MPFNTSPPWNITTLSDVTASRAFGVEYTNTTGKTMFVIISIDHGLTANTGRAFVVVESPHQIQQVAQGGIMQGFDTQQHKSTLICVISPGVNYYVSEDAWAGYNNIIRWFELW